MTMKKPGYYVEGTHYGTCFHQARARAAHLSEVYGRPIPITNVDHVEWVSQVYASNPGPVEPIDGVCCGCGYSGEEETPCPQRDDGVHCWHCRLRQRRASGYWYDVRAIDEEEA
jgi:hypothetical protein